MTDPDVHIQHLRRFRAMASGIQDGLATRAMLGRWPRDSYDILPCGGSTIATVTLPDGNKIVGVAECSSSESFNRKIGRDIATGRVLKKYRQHPDVVAGRLADAMDPRR